MKQLFILILSVCIIYLIISFLMLNLNLNLKINQHAGASASSGSQLSNDLNLTLNVLDPHKAQNKIKFDHSKYSSTKRAMKYTGKTPQPNVDHASRPAIYFNNLKLNFKNLNLENLKSTSKSTTYYMDPTQMNAAQLAKFKLKAKFENMTVADYTNWLLTFKDEPETLAGFHRGNLRIIMHGGKLRRNDMPRITKLPLTAQQEYTKTLSQGILDNVPQPEYLGYMPYNIDFQVGSIENIKNRNLRHLDFINPDEPLKTWIITHERAKSKIKVKN